MFNMIQNLQSPCYTCTNRCAGCHSNCQNYIEFTSQVNRDREIRRKCKKTLSTRRVNMKGSRYA